MLIDVLISTAEKGGVENIIKMMIEDLNGSDMTFRVVQLVWEGNAWLPEEVPFYPLLEGRGEYTLDMFVNAYSEFLEHERIPDLILATVWPYTISVAKSALDHCSKAVSNTKVISWMHHDIDEYKKTFENIEEWIGMADGHLAINTVNHKTLKRLYPQVPTYRLRNPINIPMVSCDTTKKEVNTNDNWILKLGFIGRISEEKNIELLLNAMAKVKNCELMIIGSSEDKAYEEHLRELCGLLEIGDRVYWKGWSSDPWMSADFQAVCLTSLYEGFPLAALEALSHGIPVIASRTSGIKEIIKDGVTGYTFEVGDEPALVDILTTIEKNKGLGIENVDCYNSALKFERHMTLWDMRIKLVALAIGERLEPDKYDSPWYADEQLSKDKISVIIPCHNSEKYIASCLDSVLSQSIKVAEYEIICVDDASSDNTSDILKDYEEKYNDRIMIISLDKCVKQGGARNIGLSYAAGNYIMYVDSDDLIAHDMLDKLYRLLINQDVLVAGTDYVKFVDDASPEFFKEDKGDLLVYDFSKTEVKKEYIINQGWKTDVWGRLYDRKFIEENNICFPEGKYMEDIYFSELVFMLLDKYVLLDEPLYGYRIHKDSTMFSDGIKSYYMDSFEIQNLVSREIIRRNILNECRWEFQMLHFSKAFIEEMNRMKQDMRLFSYKNYRTMVDSMTDLFPDFIDNPYLLQGSVIPYARLFNASDEDELRMLLYEL